MSPLTIIVAATRANGIGKNGGLPWRLPKEMAYFAQVTSSAPEGSTNAVLMGRNTWESIPDRFRPLRRRVNAVISHNADYLVKSVDGAPTILCSSVEEALRRLPTTASTKSIHRMFLIGGASLYQECMELPTEHEGSLDRILLTRVMEPAFEDCDTFLPDFTKSGAWHRAEHRELVDWVGSAVPEGIQDEGGVKYEFQMWTRGP